MGLARRIDSSIEIVSVPAGGIHVGTEVSVLIKVHN